jgi:hypothetical protein
MSDELVKKWLLVTNCDLVLTHQAMHTKLFPSDQQTVMQLRPTIIDAINSTSSSSSSSSSTTVIGEIMINVTSSPTTLSRNLSIGAIELTVGSNKQQLLLMGDDASLASWETQCPYYFVVPDDASSDRNSMIKGTGCSNPCM